LTGKQISVLFVCMGNICRSPLAEGVFANRTGQRGLAGQLRVDSAGTHAFHEGAPPDPRAQEAAARRNIDISAQRARCIAIEDFQTFDYVLAMDRDNFALLTYACPEELTHKVSLLMDFAPTGVGESEVPDPYFGGQQGFEKVLDLVEQAVEGLLAEIQARHFIARVR
jgi:protein-tyrosine phosphatase